MTDFKELLPYLLLFVGSIIAGVMNTVGGGGSVITLPLMILTGIPANIANATNRVGVIAQNSMAIWQFRRGGVRDGGLSWRLVLIGVPGCVLGAIVAARVPARHFDLILAVLMLGLLPLFLAKPKPRLVEEGAAEDSWSSLSPVRKASLLVAFLFLGFYAGFLQAGVGILILVALGAVMRIDLIRANMIKLVFILIQQILAFAIFLREDIAIHWRAAGVLLVGQTIGAYMGSWVALKKGEVWMNRIIVVSLVLTSAKLIWNRVVG